MTLLDMANLTVVQYNSVLTTWGQTVAGFPQVQHVLPTGGGGLVALTCYEIPITPPHGLHFASNAVGRWQYRPTVGGARRNWGSHTVPFLFQTPGLTASHLCHNPPCHNPRHLVWESLDDNKSRNWCPGPGFGCNHVVPCLAQGPLYAGLAGAMTAVAPANVALLFQL